MLGLLMLAGCGSSNSHIKATNAAVKPGTGFRTVPLEGYKGRKFGVFLPNNYTPDRKWPTLVFLHGIGETGSN
ncbi:MAG: hypothetical protein NZ561_11440, partial [Phycisphaerae bacterium]|nr:hypothetical protein [Phycisphaerae bacterium]